MHAEVTHVANTTFETKIRNHVFIMDTQASSGGDNQGPTPKEILIASIIGCTAMDVIAILKKYKMVPTKFTAAADAEVRSEHPRVFNGVKILFVIEGADITSERVNEAIEASLTKFCGVSAMVSKVVPISYSTQLNGRDVGQGEASFQI
jgi:putative redox protein